MSDISIIGAGSWGTALSVVLHKNGHKITIWSALAPEIEMLKEKHEQAEKLPGVILPDDIMFTTDLKEAIEGKDMLVLAVPSPFTRSTAKAMSPFVAEGQLIVSVAKGIEENTLMTLSEIIMEEIPQCEVAVLCGPSHAEEVGKEIPTSLVAGAKKRATAELVQNTFMSEVLRVYTSPDVLGMEIGASLKNVIALAAGMADGLGYGDNTKAALITRGISEMGRLALAMGAKYETLSGLTDSYRSLITGTLFTIGGVAIPRYVLYAVILTAVMWVIWNKTTFGKNMFAVGSNEEAANVSGVNVARTIILVFMLAGVMYGITGFFDGARIASANANTGLNYECDAIAACVIGGVSFVGGIGRISGIVVGVLLLQIIFAGLNFLSVDPNMLYIIKGLIILVACAIDMRKYLVRK